MVRIHQPASQGHPRTRRDAELSSTWDLLKDVAAAAPDVQGSSQQHQVEVPGFQQRLMSSALASSRAGLNSPLPRSAPQRCCPAPKAGVLPTEWNRNTQGLSLVTTAQCLCAPHGSAGPSCAPVTRFQLFPLLQSCLLQQDPPSFSPCHSTPPRHPRRGPGGQTGFKTGLVQFLGGRA